MDLPIRLPWLADGLTAILVLTIGAFIALAVHRALFGVTARLARRRGLMMTALEQRTRGPVRLALVILGLSMATAFAPLSPGMRAGVLHAVFLAVIALLGWTALNVMHVATVIYSRRFKVDVADNLTARKHLTQVRILERTATVFVVLLAIAAALMTFPAVRQYGVTLLASAGAAGIIAGLALQPLLTNLIAGVQIALTQPIRIDDAVIVENEWGWIEEIGSTYVVVRLWDWRRMILPLTYFIQTPFQNWTRETSALIGAAVIHVDYRAPVDAMRAKLEEIVRASPLWDGGVVNLAVTELSERAMQVRCLMSARNAGHAFDLRCLVREKMIAFLRDEYPEALPMDRFERFEGLAAARTTVR